MMGCAQNQKRVWPKKTQEVDQIGTLVPWEEWVFKHLEK